MKPTDILGNIKLYNADCMEVMKTFKDKQFDLAIVDPPYGIGADGTQGFATKKTKGFTFDKKEYTKKNWDSEIPADEYFFELQRVSKNQIIWGGNYFNLPPTRCVIVWDKCQPWENFSQIELAWTSFDSPARIYKYDNRTSGKIHPCQKPVALYTWLLNNYAKKGDKILDTHVGSASSLIACHRLGFEYIGFELDTDYYNQALERLEAEKAQITFFDGGII